MPPVVGGLVLLVVVGFCCFKVCAVIKAEAEAEEDEDSGDVEVRGTELLDV